MKKTSLLILAAGALLTLASCNSVSPTSSKPADSSATASSAQTSSVTPVASSSESSAIPTITSVTVSAAGGATSVYTSQTLQLTAAVVGTNNPATTVTWSSSANSVATVNASGLVTGVAAGEVTITATSTVDTTKSGSITLSVAEKIDKVSEITSVGKTYTIKAVVIGKDLQDVALSDGTGIIYAYFKGSSTATNKIADFAIGDYFKIVGEVGDYFNVFQFYAEAGQDSDKADIKAFTATKLTETAPTIDKTAVDFTSAMIDAHKATASDWSNAAIKFIKYRSLLTIEAGSSYSTFHTTVGTYDTRLHSLDTAAFPGLVDGGLYDVVALDFGYNTKNDYQNVLAISLTKVNVPLTGLTISGDSTVKVGEQLALSVTASPVGADKGVAWSSSDTNSATVNDKGVVTGVAASSSVTITATSTVDTSISATKVISVTSVTSIPVPSSGISINAKTLKASSASAAGWNAFTSYAQTPIVSTLNGVEVTGSVNKNVMFNTYDPWKTTDTGLEYEILQIKQGTGAAFTFGSPFTSVSSVNILCYNTFSTLKPVQIPTVYIGDAAAAVTTALTGTTYAGTKVKEVTYTESGKSKTVTIYSYSLAYDVQSLSNQKLAIGSATATSSATVYIDTISIA